MRGGEGWGGGGGECKWGLRRWEGVAWGEGGGGQRRGRGVMPDRQREGDGKRRVCEKDRVGEMERRE